MGPQAELVFLVEIYPHVTKIILDKILTQETAIKAVKSMLPEFDVYELIDKLIVIQKIDEAEKDVEGRTIPLDEVKKMIAEWKK